MTAQTQKEKHYLVLWYYLANHGAVAVRAKNPTEAINKSPYGAMEEVTSLAIECIGAYDLKEGTKAEDVATSIRRAFRDIKEAD